MSDVEVITPAEVMPPRASNLLDPKSRGKCRTCGARCPANRFYCDTHRPAKAPPRKAKRQGQTTARVAAVKGGPRSIIGDLAGDAPGKKGPPSLAEWSKALGRIGGMASILLVMAMVEADDEEVVAYLSLSDQDAEAALRPVARAVQKSKWSSKSGRDMLDNLDVLDAIWAGASWLMRLRKFATAKKQGISPRDLYLSQKYKLPLADMPQPSADYERPTTSGPSPDSGTPPGPISAYG